MYSFNYLRVWQRIVAGVTLNEPYSRVFMGENTRSGHYVVWAQKENIIDVEPVPGALSQIWLKRPPNWPVSHVNHFATATEVTPDTPVPPLQSSLL